MSHTPDWTASMSPNHQQHQHQHQSYHPAASQPSQPNPSEPGVTIKSMRLKVLYTFDEQSKVNCLARWPHVLQLKTVVLDGTTTVGVVDLKTCVQAITQCSPELVGNIGNDYAIYAFDYSEYDQPLVGQGMLSWAMAMPSPPANPQTTDLDKLVTGRVCNNIQGLFSNGVRETLEVKFRLIPVPTWSHNNFMSDMDHMSMSGQPGQVKPIQYNSMAPGSSLEVMNQLLSPNPSNNSDPFNNPVGNQEVMASSDFPGMNATTTKQAGRISRPSSRSSVKRARKPRTKETAGGDTSGYEEGTDNDDNMPSKKRAKVVQADWNGKSTFGSSADSLRVAASTTNSIRSFRPILSNGPTPHGSHMQDVPRAPTPVPCLQRKPHSSAGHQHPSRRNSTLSQSQPLRVLSPYPIQPQSSRDQDIQASIEAVMSSPEKPNSVAGSPADIASSPPIVADVSTRHSSPREAQSSPDLPDMPRTNSRQINGGSREGLTLPEHPDESTAEPTLPKLKPQAKKGRRKNDHVGFPFEQVVPGPPELLPTKMFTIDPRRQQEQALRAHRRADSVASDDGAFNSTGLTNGETRPSTPVMNNRAKPRQLLPAAPRPILAAAPPPPPVQNLLPMPARTSLPSVPHERVEHTLPQPPLQTAIPQLQRIDPPPPPSMAPSVSHDTSNLPVTAEPTNLPTISAPTPTPAIEQVSQPLPPPKDPQPRTLHRMASAGALTLPAATLPRTDSVMQPTHLSRSQTWSEGPNMSGEAEIETTKVKTAVAKKTSIRLRLESAMAEGKIPPYCHNCGAIDTPTWRKCMIKTVQGEPGYHEYSDAPGKVIAISVLTKDEDGKPTSFQMYKKTLAPSEDRSEFEEILLCNPCGIWLSKFKSHRPQDKWFKEVKPRKKTAVPRTRGGKKGRRDSEVPPTSEAWMQSDAATPGEITDGAADWNSSHAPVATMTETQPSQSDKGADFDRQRAASVKPASKADAMSNAAASNLRRSVQSSPGGRGSSHHSPIEIEDEDLGQTKRLLFPSPRREGVMKVLGYSESNTVQPVVHFSPNTADRGLTVGKVRTTTGESTALQTARNTTPPPKANNVIFKTPTRPTPSHRPVTRSVSKSDRERHDTFPHMTPTKTPTSLRRSPRHARGLTESPFTASLNKLMTEVNNGTSMSPSRHFGMTIDFSLPELDPAHLQNTFLDMQNFDAHRDFFSTDAHMPSSPPRFDMYSEGMGMSGMIMDHSDIWNDFGGEDEEGGGNGGEAVVGQFLVDESGQATFEMGERGIKSEPGEERIVEIGEGEE